MILYHKPKLLAVIFHDIELVFLFLIDKNVSKRSDQQTNRSNVRSFSYLPRASPKAH